MAPECNQFEDDHALNIAKHNVENYYSVVGVLERWYDSLDVFEHFLPRYFTNAREAYRLYMNDQPKNSNNIKPKIPQWIKDKIAANMTKEIEFYEFCKQRFHRQYLLMKSMK